MENLRTIAEPVGSDLVPVGASTGQIVHVRPDVRDVILETWLSAQRSDNTRDAYRADLRQFFAWCDAEGIETLRAVRPHIDSYARWLDGNDHHTRYPSKRKYAKTTQARKLTAVSSYFDYAVGETTAVDRNPAERVKRPAVRTKSRTTGLADDQGNDIVAEAIAEGPMAEALVRVLITTGMRVSEAINADTGDLSWNRGERVVKVGRKGGDEEFLLLGPQTADALDRYIAGRRGPLFEKSGRRLSRQQVDYLLKKLARRAGVPIRVSPHTMRHLAATSSLDDGIPIRDVQLMLGHVDPRTTVLYDDARDLLKRSPTRSLDSKFDGARPHRQAHDDAPAVDEHTHGTVTP